jgi:hypothetical protein
VYVVHVLLPTPWASVFAYTFREVEGLLVWEDGGLHIARWTPVTSPKAGYVRSRFTVSNWDNGCLDGVLVKELRLVPYLNGTYRVGRDLYYVERGRVYVCRNHFPKASKTAQPAARGGSLAPPG